MWNLAANWIIVLITVYLAGERARRNPKIDTFLTAVEGRYSRLNERLGDATISDGLKVLRTFYGWSSIALFAALVPLQRYFSVQSGLLTSTAVAFALAFMGWFSINWVTEHKVKVRKLCKENVLLIMGPLLLGFFDLMFKTSLAKALIQPLYDIGARVHFPLPPVPDSVMAGGLLSLLFLLMFGLHYLLAWMLAVPLFLGSVLVALTPIHLARTFAKLDPTDTFFWFLIFVLFVLMTSQALF